MEKKLKAMFNYQKFDRNADLQQVIDSVHDKYGMRELSLDEMGMVAAAGDTHTADCKEEELLGSLHQEKPKKQ